MSIDKAGNKPFIPVEDTTDTAAKAKTVESNKVPAGALSANTGPTPPVEGSGLTSHATFPGQPKPVVITFSEGRTYDIHPNSPLGQLFTSDVIYNKAALAKIEGGVESLSSTDLAPVMLPVATAQEAMAGLKAGTLTGSDAIAKVKKDFSGQPGLAKLTPVLTSAEQKVAAIETAVDKGKMTQTEATVAIANIDEKAQGEIRVIQDKQFIDALPHVFHNDAINNYPEVREQFVNTMNNYASANAPVHTPVVENGDKSIAKEKLSLVEQQAQLQKELEAIRAGGPFNMTTFVIAFTKALNDIRTLSNKIKIAERNATLTLQLASAEDTRQAGKERMKAALISGILGICAGAISIVGSVVALGKASSAQKVATDKMKGEITVGKVADANGELKFTDDEMTRISNAGKIAFDGQFQTLTSITNGLSTAAKSSGDMGAGIMQMTIAGVEAEGKTNDAYAQGAASREDAAKKMADDMLQLMRDIISNQQKLNDTQNSGMSTVIRNFA